jgi:hypothetical protein
VLRWELREDTDGERYRGEERQTCAEDDLKGVDEGERSIELSLVSLSLSAIIEDTDEILLWLELTFV